MAVSSKFTQKSLFGGGSTKSNTPKIDTSYGANLGGGQQNNIVNLPTLSGGGNSGGLTAANENVLKKTLGNTPTVTIPQNLTYQNNLKNMTGIIGQGGASGGVTDEGVIVGNPNVEKMPTINRTTASGSKPQTSPMTYGQQLAAAAQQQTPTESTPDTSGGTGATGSTGATGGSTTGSGEVDTYEEFLLKQEGFYKEQLDKLNAQIEQNKQNALQQAESERERAVIDARSSYEQNKATYGANAEQLAAMGLSGSGYSDYLNQQAYATQRAETQNANAQAEATKLAAEQQANSDKLNAELSYAENMQGNAEKLAQYQQQKAEEAKAEEEQKKQYYAALLTSANTGEYTSEQIASLGAQYGLDEAQISQLQAAADKYKSDQQSLSYTEALQMISDYGADLDVSYLETLLNTGSVSQEQYDQLMAQYSKELIESGDLANEDTDKIDDLHQSGQISEEDYNKQKEQWNSQIDTSDAFFNSGSMSASEAKKQLDKILNNEWTSGENKKALQETYDNLYKVVTNDVRFNNDGGWRIFGSTDMDDVGNNFSLIDNSGFKYRIESGGKVTDSAITSIARDVADGSIFGLRGQIYYKKDGNVYLVRKRENSYGDHYTKLYNKFFG
jgi:hypothetical protein|nr:MAG TPA: hypothetical protein [Caudoviricetes sp.]